MASRRPAGPVTKRLRDSCVAPMDAVKELRVYRNPKERPNSSAQIRSTSLIELVHPKGNVYATYVCIYLHVILRLVRAPMTLSQIRTSNSTTRLATGIKIGGGVQTIVLGHNFLTFALQFTRADVSFPTNSSPSGRSDERRSRPPRSTAFQYDAAAARASARASRTRTHGANAGRQLPRALLPCGIQFRYRQQNRIRHHSARACDAIE